MHMMNLPRKRSSSSEYAPAAAALGRASPQRPAAHLQQNDYEQLQAFRMAKRMRLAQAHAAAAAAAHETVLFRQSSDMMLMDPTTRLLLAQQRQRQATHNAAAAAGLGVGLYSMTAALNPTGMSMPAGMATNMATGLPMAGMGLHSFPSAGAAFRASHQAGLNDLSIVGRGAPPHMNVNMAAALHAPVPSNSAAAGHAHAARLSPSRGRLSRDPTGDASALSPHLSSTPTKLTAADNGRESPLEKLSALASCMPAIALPNLNGHNEHHNSCQILSLATTKLLTTEEEALMRCLPTSHHRNISNNKGRPSPPPPFQLVKRSNTGKGSNMKTVSLPTPTITSANNDIPYYEQRDCMPLSIDEDVNWLSEFQQFLRGHILEVFVASSKDVETRTASKKIAATQVGIRCRFCAHLHPSERASRSSAFPSSVRQIYQSFTMMLREHLSGQCEAIPPATKQHFLLLKGQSAQSASDSKRYWIYAAQKLGMVDTGELGIQWTPTTQNAALTMTPFGGSPELALDLKQAAAGMADNTTILVSPTDKPVVSDFTYAIVKEAVLVHLANSEKIGNRSCLTVGLPGMACRHCCSVGRSGLSRVFPARRRNLKTKVNDLYDHLRRCTLVPEDIQEHLQSCQAEAAQGSGSDKKSKVFYARLWRRLGHDNDEPTSAANGRSNSTPLSP